MTTLEALLRFSVIRTEMLQLAEVFPSRRRSSSGNVLNLIMITSSADLDESSEHAEADPKDPEGPPRSPPRSERRCRSSSSPRVVRLGTPRGS